MELQGYGRGIGPPLRFTQVSDDPRGTCCARLRGSERRFPAVYSRVQNQRILDGIEVQSAKSPISSGPARGNVALSPREFSNETGANRLHVHGRHFAPVNEASVVQDPLDCFIPTLAIRNCLQRVPGFRFAERVLPCQANNCGCKLPFRTKFRNHTFHISQYALRTETTHFGDGLVASPTSLAPPSSIASSPAASVSAWTKSS
jgi:hypothetical protein